MFVTCKASIKRAAKKAFEPIDPNTYATLINYENEASYASILIECFDAQIRSMTDILRAAFVVPIYYLNPGIIASALAQTV